MANMDDFLNEIGKPIECHMSVNSLIPRVQEHLESLGKDIQITYWTDPPNANPDNTRATVYVMRIDGMSEDQIEAVKASCVKDWRCVYADEFILDPQAINAKLSPAAQCKPNPNKLPKASKLGWETMTLGEIRTFRLLAKDLRFLLCRAILIRGLDWRFKCKRMPFLEEPGLKRSVPVWQVTRVH